MGVGFFSTIEEQEQHEPDKVRCCAEQCGDPQVSTICCRHQGGAAEITLDEVHDEQQHAFFSTLVCIDSNESGEKAPVSDPALMASDPLAASDLYGQITQRVGAEQVAIKLQRSVSPLSDDVVQQDDVVQTDPESRSKSGSLPVLDGTSHSSHAISRSLNVISRSSISSSLRKLSSGSVAEMHTVPVFQHYGKSLWLIVQSFPVVALCFAWAVLTDHGCENGRRNLLWFQWFYDQIYTFFGIMTCVSVFDVCYLTTGCSNWGRPFRCKFWIVSVAAGMLTCVALNLLASHGKIHTSEMSWLFGKTIVIFASTVTAFALLLCALWHTSGRAEKIFAIKSWILIFIFAVWALIYYIANQIFVAGYVHFQKRVATDSDGFWSWSSLYDYSVACFFCGVYVQLWTHSGLWIMAIVRETAPPLQKDRLHFLVVLWSSLFATVFGRVIFKEVQDPIVLQIVMLKDSVVHVMDLTLKYNPTRMIRMAITQESEDASWCFFFSENIIGLILDIDLRLTLEFLFGFRSHSHHCHHLPDEAYMSDKVRQQLFTHHHHVARSHWRISRSEANPELEDSFEDPYKIYPPDTLHWSGAMRRWKEHRYLLEKNPIENYTSLHPGLRSIEWCKREYAEGEEEETHQLHSMFWWHHYLCSAGLTRSEIKSYLAYVWNCKDWTADREFEAEALCDRMCFVQRNIRLMFVATYLPKIVSSVFGMAFLFARSEFPCTLEAYGYEAKPTSREIWIWIYLTVADLLELVLIAFHHKQQKLYQEGDVGWIFVSHVLWDKVFMAMTVFVSIHIVQDAMIASYKLDF